MKLSDITGAIRAYKAATRLETVSDEEAAKRAAICLQCRPWRQRTRGVSKVSQALAQYAGLNNADKRISDYSCSLCGCSLLLLTSALPENLHKDSPEQKAKRAKTKCWMNQL